jgi:hypothetical protein
MNNKIIDNYYSENFSIYNNSTILLIISNIIAIGFAVFNNWSLAFIVLIYWCQSIIIGIFQFLKILNLKNFTTDGFRINERTVDANEKTKKTAAIFFAFHFGFFHIVYLIFILLDFHVFDKLESMNLLFFLVSIILFFITHLFSYLHNKERDANKRQNIGKVIFYPYARIIPMHLIIIFGGFFVYNFGNGISQIPIVIFLILKTIADVIMHINEHKDPSNYLFKNNKFEINLDKDHFFPGETIKGKITIDLAKQVKAKSLILRLLCKKEYIPKAIGEYQSHVVYNQKLLIKGQKIFYKDSYNFKLIIPEDVLLQANNWFKKYNIAELSEKSFDFMKNFYNEKESWYLELELNIPFAPNIKERKNIKIDFFKNSL